MGGKTSRAIDIVVHRWLRAPYRLHATELRSPKKPRATLVFIHGLGNSYRSWEPVVAHLPRDVRVIALDLLGFGLSPKPAWVTYSIDVQARSVAKTVAELGLAQRPVIVGHSMGTLVAIELARRFPLVIRRLILFNPPLYTQPGQKAHPQEKALKEFYAQVVAHPDDLQKVAPYVVKLGITSKAFDVSGEIARSYVAALEASIIHQRALRDIATLRLPVRIVYGAFDPLVIGAYIKGLAATRPNITAKMYPVGHEINGTYEKIAADEVTAVITEIRKNS